jgi:hypothetical protein
VHDVAKVTAPPTMPIASTPAAPATMPLRAARSVAKRRICCVAK